ncbi:MAG TPA: phospholipase D-like domain-containing protein [Vicinamibacterales bacterium]|nr:phospholipase D-like domain-containing protein [Vicinamibacterales bacterium]
MRRLTLAVAAVLVVVAAAAPARGAESLCDPAYQDCRTPLLNLINNETVGIDVAFWFMTDARYEAALLNRWKAGVPIRVIVDPRANPTYDGNAQVLQDLANAGIPMRYRLATDAGILHWKMMLFAGQNMVEFDGANFSPTAFVYTTPYTNYEWESIYFTDDPAIVNSFKTEYDNFWMDDNVYYGNYANIVEPRTRVYPTYSIDPDLNFPQEQDYALRILKRYAAETQKIDVIMYRITDARHPDAMIAAMQRGIPVRVLGDTLEYRLPSRLWAAYNLDRLYAAGVPVRVASANDINHQKLVILYGQAMAVFGSSNWTTPSANQQQEHNYFTTKPWMFQWFSDQFERKWNNTAGNESVPFVPLPPDKPVILSPAPGAVGVDRSLELKWDGGPWAHIYDIYFGTDPNPPLFAANQQLGPTDPANPTATQHFTVPLMQPGTTYYWRIVGKTMAGLTAKSAIVGFTTAGAAPPPPPPAGSAATVVLWTCTDVAQANISGAWQFVNDSTAAGGCALWNPDRNSGKISPPLASPANYFQTTFDAVAGVPYHVWIRMRAQANSTSNDSVTFQFDDSIDQYGSPLYQIGTAEGGETALNDPSGTVNGWGWADNGLGGPATLLDFPSNGPHTIQIQQRQDGAYVDQIVISPDAFLSAIPGGTINDHTIYGSTIDGASPPPDPAYYPPPPPIPAPWQQTDIGAVNMPGYASFDSGSSVFTSEGAGADVWGAADAFHYIYQPLSGDGTIVARVASLQNTNVWTKAGVMIRESLAAGATNAFMFVASTKGLNYQGRTATNGSTASLASLVKPAPYWVRVDRAGDTFTGYRSPDGVTWTQVGTYTIPMASTALVGLALTSHNADATAVATFDNVLVNNQPTCGYTVSPWSASFTSDGGSSAVSLTTGPNCTWTAATGDTSWLTVDTATGAGSATVNLTAASNAGAARSTTYTLGGQTWPASQSGASCGLTLTPSSQNVPNSGGTLTIDVTAGSWCSWTAASSDSSWLSVTGGASGTGNGTVTVNAAANAAGGRTAFVTIGDKTFTAAQDPAPCSYSISPASQSFAYGGGSSTVAVTTGGWCSWTAASNDTTWLTVTAGASGTGNGSVTLSATVNGAAARSTTATIAGKTLTASEASAPCVFTLSPASQSMSYAGDSGSFSVSVGSWCSWTASSSAPWLSITSGGSGSGAGAVSVAAAANNGGARSATVSVGGQTFTANQGAPPAPTNWSNQDIGAVGIAGATSSDSTGAQLTVTGAGADVWGTSDALQYAYQTLNGDGSIVAHVTSVQNVNAWTKAGVMIRETTDPGSAQAFMLLSYSKGTAFQRREATGGTSVNTTGSTTLAAPYWVRLDRAGNTFTAYQSPDGVMWSVVGTDTIPMAAVVLAGVGVSSHTTTATATATFDNVSIAAGARPGWVHQDIGSVGAVGTATYDPNAAAYSVKGAGADIWGTADAFHFAWRQMSGDGVVVARVTGVQNTNAWTKAGVMIRETLDPGSTNALMLVSSSKGLSFQRRVAAGGVSTNTAGALVGAPYWVKLERIGSTFNAYASPDGAAWTLVGTDTIPMAANVYVGLAVSSHTSGTAAIGTFDNVSTP